MIVQAYDQHLNMILGEVEEVTTSVEIDDETYEEIVRVILISHLRFCHALLYASGVILGPFSNVFKAWVTDD